MNEEFQTVAIVGVGLIGGSFALALREAGYRGRILGVSSPATLAAAKARGVIDAGAMLPAAVAQADLIYLAQPVRGILDTLPVLAPHLRPHALVTDAGSTKQEIVTAAERSIPAGQFLGGHPLAGKAERGVSAADAALFQDRTYVLTPTEVHPATTPAASCLQDWLHRCGARVIQRTPQEHDRLVATTSHLPQLLSTALATVVGDRLQPPDYAVSGPGLRDMTRLAASSYDIWQDILHTNADEIRAALAAYQLVLTQIQQDLQRPPLERVFDEAAITAKRVQDWFQ